MADVVAVWSVSLSDGIHKVQFEHGTTSGKRVIFVDGKVTMSTEYLCVTCMNSFLDVYPITVL